MKECLDYYTRVLRGRCARLTGKRARHVLLNEYCQTTGRERKYANTVLRGRHRSGPSGSAGKGAGESRCKTLVFQPPI